MASKISKSDFLGEACKTTAVNVRCLCTDLTLLINACDEAASYRARLNMPHVEKYTKMSQKLRHLSEELDQQIDKKCDTLFRIAKAKKS